MSSRRAARALALGSIAVAGGLVASTLAQSWSNHAPSTPAAIAATIRFAAPPPPAGPSPFRLCSRACRRSRAPVVPRPRRVATARRWLLHRAGRTAFAVVLSDGTLHGLRVHDRFRSASLVKAMLLTAYLRRAAAEGRPLDARERALLDAMIRVSDNDAASAIFAVVGEAGLVELAQLAGMTDFAPSPAWGLSQISARDQARFFQRLRHLVPHRLWRFAHELLSSVVAAQSWGIPAVARPAGFIVLFKGGWLEGIVNQAARLERGDVLVSLAVLTDANPSMAYGIETIEGVTARLLGRTAERS